MPTICQGLPALEKSTFKEGNSYIIFRYHQRQACKIKNYSSISMLCGIPSKGLTVLTREHQPQLTVREKSQAIKSTKQCFYFELMGIMGTVIHRALCRVLLKNTCPSVQLPSHAASQDQVRCQKRGIKREKLCHSIWKFQPTISFDTCLINKGNN